MRKDDIIRQATLRLAIATELMHQLWAVQTFENNEMLGKEQARVVAIDLVDEYLKQTDIVSALVGQFLEEMAEGSVEQVRYGRSGR
jgi:hypothetical protein